MDPLFSDEEYRFHEELDRIRDQKIRARELQAITQAKFISGEMFDLTATSLNNEFGYDHTIGILKYGINFPLNKFIIELTKIVVGTISDKSDKRRLRLNCLQYCVGCNELEIFFRLFCNRLNGGGEKIRGEWDAQQYYKNLMIITAAGGNIIILFAQLLVNMIDKSTNKTSNWDINAPDYTPITKKELDEEANPLFEKDYSKLTAADKSKLTDIFNLLTPTNKLILTALQAIFGKEKEKIYFKIVKYLIILHSNILESLYSVAKSIATDFDFKLSSNIHPSLLQDSSSEALFEAIQDLSGEPEKIEDVDTFIAELQKKIDSLSSDIFRGFTLTRTKTLVDNSEYYKPDFKPEELKKFKKNCASKFQRLYPQIMEDHYLTEVPADSDCWKFLNHLKRQKDAIRDATQNSIDETIKFHLAGYYKQANILGDMFPVVNPSLNSTEAIFSYISDTAYYLNIYIQNWEQGKFRTGGAPAFYEGRVPSNWNHTNVCDNFLSLNSILDNNDSLIPRLCADILNYFLNGPEFKTELILDNLLKAFNKKREALTGKKSECTMPPSHLILVPTNATFNPSLKKIKEIINRTRYSELGYPDGIRITLNAIATQNEFSENKDKLEQYIAEHIIKPNTELASSYDILPSNSLFSISAGPSKFPPETSKSKKQKAESQIETNKEKKSKAEGYIKIKKLRVKKVKTKKTQKKYKQLKKQKSKKYKKKRQYTSKK